MMHNLISFLNRAFYPETYELTHTQKLVDQYGDWFSHKNTSRANIIMREQEKVNEIFWIPKP